MTWAFIFKTDEGNGAGGQLKTVLNHGADRLLVYGVNTIEQGKAIAGKIVEEDGCMLIELCGGFTASGAKEVIDAIGNKIPVGHIEYLPEAQERLSILQIKG
jgi:hypothetical protein